VKRVLPANDLRLCQACRAAIVLARVWRLEDTPVRRPPTWIPLDAIPLENDDGNVAWRRSPAGGLLARVLRKDETPMADERKAMPHFATCPAAKARREAAGLPPGVASLEHHRRKRKTR